MIEVVLMLELIEGYQKVLQSVIVLLLFDKLGERRVCIEHKDLVLLEAQDAKLKSALFNFQHSGKVLENVLQINVVVVR